MKLRSLTLAFVLAAQPATAFACEYDHDEDYLFANAAVIYIAEVIGVGDRLPDISGFTFRTSTVKPLKAIRGRPPKNHRTLSAMRSPQGCGGVTGDGDGAFEQVGTLVFVFEGLPTAGNYPRGIQSFDINAADKPELLELAGELSEADLRK